MQFILIASYVFTTASGLIVLKLGSANGALIEFVNSKISLNITTLNILGVFLYGLSFLLYLYLIAKNDLGYIIPLTTALVYVLIFLASYTIFNETFTITKLAGIALIIIGIVLLNLKS